MTSPLVIIGAGGLGLETAAVVSDLNAAGAGWRLLGFVDDDEARHGQEYLGVPVIGNLDWLVDQGGVQYVIAIGSSAARLRVGKRLGAADVEPATLVHPSVAGHASHRIGGGVIVFRGAVIMLSVDLGEHVVVDVNATIGHDARLGAYTSIRPGVHLSGNTVTGTAADIGAGAVVLEGLSIGDHAIVGAGAVVTTDLPPDCTAVGVPARPVQR